MRPSFVSPLLAVAGMTLAFGFACGGRMAGPPVCSEALPCGKEFGCVLGRCRNDKTVPVATLAPRFTFEPIDIVWIGSEGKRTRADVDPAIMLGAKGRETTLLVKFALDLSPPSPTPPGNPKKPGDAPVVQRALLVLEPMPLCEAKSGTLKLEVADVLEPWSASRVVGRKLPRMAIPAFAGTFPTAPAQALRVDITEIVREWARRPGKSFGLAVLATSSNDSGGCYASGNAIGRGPRLEVYLQVPEPKKKETKGTGAGGGGGRDAGTPPPVQDEEDDEEPAGAPR